MIANFTQIFTDLDNFYKVLVFYNKIMTDITILPIF